MVVYSFVAITTTLKERTIRVGILTAVRTLEFRFCIRRTFKTKWKKLLFHIRARRRVIYPLIFIYSHHYAESKER
jgi:hypothetical protein